MCHLYVILCNYGQTILDQSVVKQRHFNALQNSAGNH